MTKILYISYDGMTDPLGQSQVLPYLKGLSKEGFHFHLISFEKEERFLKFFDQIQEICTENNIVWHPLSYTKKPPLLSTIYDVQRMMRLAKRLHSRHSFSIIHCRSYIASLVGLRMKRKFGTGFLFDMRGFWADERIEGNIWSKNNPIFKMVYTFFKGKEREFLTKADYTISLTHSAKDEIESWPDWENGIPPIEVIPCCADLELFDRKNVTQDDINSRKKELGLLDDNFVLGYVGSVGTWYMIDEMLDYFNIVLENNTKAKFLFVTGDEPLKITSIAHEKNIDLKSIIITSCLHKDVPLHISLFDASVFFIRPTFSKKASSPTKQGEIMSMGIPLLCNSGVGDTDLVVKQYLSGNVLDEFNAETYLKNLPSNFRFDESKTIVGAKEFYGLETGIQRYKGVYEKILKSQEAKIL